MVLQKRDNLRQFSGITVIVKFVTHFVCREFLPPSATVDSATHEIALTFTICNAVFVFAIIVFVVVEEPHQKYYLGAYQFIIVSLYV